MKTTTRIVFLCAVLFLPLLRTGAQNPSAPAGLDAINAFAGRWIISGEMRDTAYSRAAKMPGDETTCSWSSNHGFLLCDQMIHTPAGMLNQLSIYTYNEKDRTYAFFGLGRDGGRVRTPKLTIEGDLWTYSGEFDDGAKHIRTRTTNKFVTPDRVLWRSEFSDDDGAHWVLMGAGADTRAS